MKLEICANSYQSALNAQEAGALKHRGIARGLLFTTDDLHRDGALHWWEPDRLVSEPKGALV